MVRSSLILYYKKPALYCFLQIINQSFFLSLFSLLNMSIATVYTSTFVNRISPLIMYLFLTVSAQMLYKFLGISLFVLIFPDLIFMPFNVDGQTILGFTGEKIVSYSILIIAVIIAQYFLYRKYSKNYLK